MPTPLIGVGIKRRCCLTSVCLTSVAYISPKSRTERHRKTKIGTEVAYVTRDSNTSFKVKRSMSQEAGILWRSPAYSLFKQRIMEVLVTIGTISRAKLQSNHHHNKPTPMTVFTDRMPLLCLTTSVKALKVKYHIPWSCLPQLTWESSDFVFDC